MKHADGLPRNVDEYIAAFPPDVRVILRKIRTTIRKAAPDAQEKISYQMPGYFLDGNLVYFAGYKNHVGFYPGSSAIESFASEALTFHRSKGTIRFPLDEAIPFVLIGRIVKFRVKQNLEKAKSKKANAKRKKSKGESARERNRAQGPNT